MGEEKKAAPLPGDYDEIEPGIFVMRDMRSLFDDHATWKAIQEDAETKMRMVSWEERGAARRRVYLYNALTVLAFAALFGAAIATGTWPW